MAGPGSPAASGDGIGMVTAITAGVARSTSAGSGVRGGRAGAPSSRSTSSAARRPSWRPSTSATGAIEQLKAQSKGSSVQTPSPVVAPGGDAQPPLEGGEQFQRAQDPAGHAHADAGDPAAGRGETELRIVGGHAIDLTERHAKMLGHRGKVLGRDPAPLVLDGVKGGEQPGTLAGEALEGDHGAATGSWRFASAKPRARRRQESQAPHGRPSGPGS